MPLSCGSTVEIPSSLLHSNRELLQAGMIGQRAVIRALVTFFQDGARNATEDSPGGMVVDLGPCPWRPDEYLKRVGAAWIVVAIGHVPVLDPFRFLQKGQNVRTQKVGIPHYAGQDGNGLPHSHLHRKNVGFVRVCRERHLAPRSRLRCTPTLRVGEEVAHRQNHPTSATWWRG